LSHDHARTLVRRIAFLAVDTMIKMERYEVDSAAVENNIMAIHGYIGRLRKMRYALAKHKALKKLARQRTVKKLVSSS